MSSKSRRKVSLTNTTATPRAMADIQDEYGKLLPAAGQLQYEIKVKADDLNQVNAKLLNLNQEAHARKELDAKTPAPEATNESN
jgi:hypothetical protein